MKAFRPSYGLPLRTWLLSLWVLLAPSTLARAQPAGKLQSPPGSLLARTARSPQLAVVKGEVPTGELLLALPGERAEVVSKSGAVQLSVWANLQELYDFPILETALVLHPDPARDFDLTLERGRVLLTQTRQKRAAEVRVTFQKNVFDFTLSEPGTQLALEAFGRWPSGSAFVKGVRPDRSDDVPTQMILAYTIKGTASVKLGQEQYLMPALSSFQWDNVVGRSPVQKRNAKLPAWAEEQAAKPEARALHAAVEKLRGLVAKSGADKAVREALGSNEPELRRVAVASLGAVDDLPGLVDALTNPRQPDVRSAAVPVLRHWIGRGPGQDMQLYNFLVQQRMFTPNQAENVLRLLHGFPENERRRSETLDHLIENLRHPQPAIRELASYYLYLWIPEGRKILYDAGGSPAQIEQGYKEWKKLVPNGKLPARK
jgi:hypothetical protein